MKNTFILKSFIIASFFITLILFSGCNSSKEVIAQTNNMPNSEKEVNKITIPVSEISENAKLYKYEIDGKMVSFFAVKDSYGKLKTAFNACDVCYPEKKGYRQEGNYMVCNNCGLKFAINGIGTENKVSGGCWPGYLPSKIEGQYIIIEKEALENGKWRF